MKYRSLRTVSVVWSWLIKCSFAWVGVLSTCVDGRRFQSWWFIIIIIIIIIVIMVSTFVNWSLFAINILDETLNLFLLRS